jgi:hypothetical protein
MESPDCLALPTDEIAHPVHEHRVVFAGFIALFVALASALLPGSLPSSQTVGSAFNPATTQVALARTDSEETANLAAVGTRSDTIDPGGTMDTADPGLPSLFWTDAPAFAAMLPPPVHSAKDDVASERRLPGAGPRAPPGEA